MRLTAYEQGLLDGAAGEAVRRALVYQLQVGEFFQAEDFVPVRSAHLMADAEALRDDGVALVEELAELGGRFCIPTTTNPRSVDLAHVLTLRQRPVWPARERRLIAALGRLGAVQCHTCVNYQTLDPPLFGEHLAWGDTGAVIWANSMGGARSNFEAGTAALMAGLTGRVPRYGYHLDAVRRPSVRVEVTTPLPDLADWGALGCWAGRRIADCWTVPAFSGLSEATPDALKHLGAALASYGSCAMFHALGVTPEARDAAAAFGSAAPRARWTFGAGELAGVYQTFPPNGEGVDLVVFSAPQLSSFELRDLAARFEGRRVARPTLVTVNQAVRADAQASGYAASLERAGVVLLTGVCYYIMAPQDFAADHGWRRLVTNSAKLANIIAGYGYHPVFRPTATCVQAALTGALPS